MLGYETVTTSKLTKIAHELGLENSKILRVDNEDQRYVAYISGEKTSLGDTAVEAEEALKVIASAAQKAAEKRAKTPQKEPEMTKVVIKAEKPVETQPEAPKAEEQAPEKEPESVMPKPTLAPVEAFYPTNYYQIHPKMTEICQNYGPIGEVWHEFKRYYLVNAGRTFYLGDVLANVTHLLKDIATGKVLLIGVEITVPVPASKVVELTAVSVPSVNGQPTVVDLSPGVAAAVPAEPEPVPVIAPEPVPVYRLQEHVHERLTAKARELGLDGQVTVLGALYTYCSGETAVELGETYPVAYEALKKIK